jgi:hypothetical protein
MVLLYAKGTKTSISEHFLLCKTKNILLFLFSGKPVLKKKNKKKNKEKKEQKL